MDADFSSTAILQLVRLMLLACTLQFLCLTAAAALFFLGYYYRGWPEKISSVLARGFIVASPTPPLTIPQFDPVLGPLVSAEWPWMTAFFVLVGLSCGLNGYAYSKLYMPRLRSHPAYRPKGYYEPR